MNQCDRQKSRGKRYHKIRRKQIMIPFAQRVQKPDDRDADQRGCRAVEQLPAEEYREPARDENCRYVFHPYGIDLPIHDAVKFLVELCKGRRFRADIPRQVIQIIQPVKIDIISDNPANLREDFSVRSFHRHLNIGGNDKDIDTVAAIRPAHALYTVLHAADLRAGHQHFLGNIQNCLQQPAVIHFGVFHTACLLPLRCLFLARAFDHFALSAPESVSFITSGWQLT